MPEEKQTFAFRIKGKVFPGKGAWMFSLKICELKTDKLLDEYIIGPWPTKGIADQELKNCGDIVLKLLQEKDPRCRTVNLNQVHHEVH